MMRVWHGAEFRGWWLLALALWLGLLAAPAWSFDDPVQGQSLFVDKGCVRCHAVRGTGGNIGPDLGRASVKASFYELASRMWNHTGSMESKMEEFRIPRARLEGDELADLIAFLYFLNYFDEPGNPEVGKVLFADKHCIQCHRIEGEGGREGPALDSLPRGASPLRIAQGLWNHGPAMMRSIRRRGLEVPVFRDGEIIDLFAYLRSRGRREETRQFQSAGDAVKGRLLFDTKGCTRCHEVFGDDDEIGPDLGRSELRGSVTQLAGRMWNHWPAMAEAMEVLDIPLPEFSGDELADIFAYLFISRYDGEHGDVGRGQAIYEELGCTGCHGASGEGRVGELGPPLRNLTQGESKERIVQRMWNHAPKMSKRMSEQQIGWPRFTAQQLADLLIFLSQGWPELAGEGTR